MAISFDCVKCGKCCNTGPALSVAEAFKHQDRFITSLRYEVQHLNPKYPETVSMHGEPFGASELLALKEHQSGISPVINAAGAEFSLHIYPFTSGYSLVRGNKCEALDADMGCSLQGDKPAMCSSVPFDIMLPESLQRYTLKDFKNFGCAKEIADDEAGQRVIFRHGAIVDTGFQVAYQQRLSDWMVDAADIYQMIALMKDGLPFAPELSTLMEAAAGGAILETSMAPILFILVLNDWSQKEKVDAFVAAQTALINREIGRAMIRKNRAERERTNTLRSHVKIYQYLLQMLDDPEFPGRNQIPD